MLCIECPQNLSNIYNFFSNLACTRHKTWMCVSHHSIKFIIPGRTIAEVYQQDIQQKFLNYCKNDSFVCRLQPIPLQHNAYNHEKISYPCSSVDRCWLPQIVFSVNQREKYWIPITEVNFNDSSHYLSNVALSILKIPKHYSLVVMLGVQT